MSTPRVAPYQHVPLCPWCSLRHEQPCPDYGTQPLIPDVEHEVETPEPARYDHASWVAGYVASCEEYPIFGIHSVGLDVRIAAERRWTEVEGVR